MKSAKPTKAEILAAADSVERLPKRSRALLRTLADLSENGPASASQAEMALRHNRSVTWVRLAAEPLIAVGIVRRHRARNGAEKSRYSIHLPREQRRRQTASRKPSPVDAVQNRIETLTAEVRQVASLTDKIAAALIAALGPNKIEVLTAKVDRLASEVGELAALIEDQS